MDEVRVLIGEKRYVTLYTMEKIDSLISSGTVLPTPSVSYRGSSFTLEGASGVADIVYVCVKDATDTYVWKDTLTFRFAP